MKRLMLVSTIAFALAAPVSAQDHSGHSMPATSGGATEAYAAASAAMHEDMMVDYTGDADVDFVRSMIPHHQGAVAMAKIVLQHGSDPEVKALADAVVATQEDEIAFMQAWLAKKGLAVQ